MTTRFKVGDLIVANQNRPDVASYGLVIRHYVDYLYNNHHMDMMNVFWFENSRMLFSADQSMSCTNFEKFV